MTFQAEVFFAPSASTDDVAEAGDKAIAILYNGKSTDTHGHHPIS